MMKVDLDPEILAALIKICNKHSYPLHSLRLRLLLTTADLDPDTGKEWILTVNGDEVKWRDFHHTHREHSLFWTDGYINDRSGPSDDLIVSEIAKNDNNAHRIVAALRKAEEKTKQDAASQPQPHPQTDPKVSPGP